MFDLEDQKLIYACLSEEGSMRPDTQHVLNDCLLGGKKMGGWLDGRMGGW